MNNIAVCLLRSEVNLTEIKPYVMVSEICCFNITNFLNDMFSFEMDLCIVRVLKKTLTFKLSINQIFISNYVKEFL